MLERDRTDLEPFADLGGQVEDAVSQASLGTAVDDHAGSGGNGLLVQYRHPAQAGQGAAHRVVAAGDFDDPLGELVDGAVDDDVAGGVEKQHRVQELLHLVEMTTVRPVLRSSARTS